MAGVKGKDNYAVMPQINSVDIIPPGGSTGQVLAKNSATSYDTAWVAGGGVTSVSGTTNQIAITGTASVPIVGFASNPVVPGTGSITLPNGTTAQRPGSPTSGMIRFNTTLGQNEYYNGTGWVLAGSVLQMVTGTIAASTTNSVIPFDNTVPQSSEGTQLWSRSFTPVLANSTILVVTTGFFTVGTGADRFVTLATFNGTTCFSATLPGFTTTTGEGRGFNLASIQAAGSTATRTYSARIGSNNSSGTLYINQGDGGENYGGTVNISTYLIQEIAP